MGSVPSLMFNASSTPLSAAPASARKSLLSSDKYVKCRWPEKAFESRQRGGWYASTQQEPSLDSRIFDGDRRWICGRQQSVFLALAKERRSDSTGGAACACRGKISSRRTHGSAAESAGGRARGSARGSDEESVAGESIA